MTRAYNTVGGGANTNVNGLEFEARTHLYEALQNHPDFEVHQNIIYKYGAEIGRYYE